MGSGRNLLGLYDIYNNRVQVHDPDQYEDGRDLLDLDEEGEIVGDHPIKADAQYGQTLEEALLLKEAGNDFDREKIMAGDLTPVFFGSALTNFGVQNFLDAFLEFAPKPSSQEDKKHRVIQPSDPNFSGFVFKIQANMDPRHRDRIAFLRICSGQFERGMDVTLARGDKAMKLTNSTSFMAEDRETVTKAVAGDIIGLYDTGTFQIGDTIYSGKEGVEFKDLPQFTPEIFMKVDPKNVMKQKSFHKGLEQLVQEGAIQLYKTYLGNDYIVGQWANFNLKY